MKTHRNESGQAIVLIGLALVAILGFAALAVDGGRLYSEQRRAQNAADAAAYAAASASVDSDPWAAAGLAQAGMNGYADASEARDDAALMDVMVFNPPEDGPYASDTAYYQVKIRNHVDQAFSQIVYPHGLEVSVEAVAHALPSGPLSAGDAIVALSPHGCQAMKFHGSEGIIVNGGNVNSKSDAHGTPASCDSIVQMSGAGEDANIIVNGGDIISAGTQDFQTGAVEVNGGGTLQPGTTTPDLPVLPVPDCSHLVHRTYAGGDATLWPGIYSDGIKISGNNTDVRLMPGMYCLDGGANGGLVVTGGDLNGNEVLIVARQGSISLGGNGTIALSRPKSLLDGLGTQWGGMLFYMPYANTGEVHISGGAGTVFYGTIYAPGPRSPESQDKCVMEGSSAPISVNSSIFCYSIKVGGTKDVVIDFDAGQNYQMAGSIEMSQ